MMTILAKIDARKAFELLADPETLLVCAYEGDEEFRQHHLEGAISLHDFLFRKEAGCTVAMSMPPTEIDLDAYFARIRYAGPRKPTLALLHAIVAHHVTAIPFENLDVLLSRPILLEPASPQ